MADSESFVTKLKKINANVNTYLNSDNAVAKLFEKAEEKTGIQRVYLFRGFLFFMAIYLLIGYAADIVCFAIGFIYPAYASIKAIESECKEDDTKWLTYWVVFSAFSLFEYIFACALYWIPLYWFFKCIFLVVCMLPEWNVSVTLYRRWICPCILPYMGVVDSAADAMKRTITDGSRAVTSATVQSALGGTKMD